MRKLPFSCSTPRGDRTTNIEPNIASDLFCHALYSMYACISNKPTPELFILIFAASFLLVDRFFMTILNILGKLSLHNWRCCNVHGPLPHTKRQLTPAMTQVMTPARKRSVPSCKFTCSDLDKRANRLGFQPKSFMRRHHYNSHISPALQDVPSYSRAQPPSTCISKPWLRNHVNCHSSKTSAIQPRQDKQKSNQSNQSHQSHQSYQSHQSHQSYQSHQSHQSIQSNPSNPSNP